MPKYLLVIETDPTEPSHEEEYHEWYNKIHIPDIFETKGFVKATRYELQELTKGSTKPRFLVIYEIETDDLEAVKAKHSKNMAQKKDQGRSTSINMTSSRAIYKQIFSYPE